MKKWITGLELLQRLEMSISDLKQLINDGELSVYAPETIVQVDCEWVLGGAKVSPSPRSKIKGREDRLTFFRLEELFFDLDDVEAWQSYLNYDLVEEEERKIHSNPAHQESGTTELGTTEQRKASNAEQEIETPKQQEQDFKEENNKIKYSDTFIRSLQVFYVSDTEIKIRGCGKGAKIYTCEEMGFKKKSEAWKVLITVLQSNDNTYHVGIYSADKDPIKNRNYNKLVQRLRNFSKKFVFFLNDKYSASLPESLNVFENMKGYDRDGTYKPIFHIADKPDAIHSTDINKMSKKETLDKLETLSKQRKCEKDESERERLLDVIGYYAEHAKKMGWINEEHLRNLISLPDKEASAEDAMSLVERNKDINKL